VQRNQKTASDKERVQLLFLGRHRVTIQKWARAYRKGGLIELLRHKPHPGAPSTLPTWVETKLSDLDSRKWTGNLSGLQAL
jgi:transposase